jgi:hypothetical protein
MECHREAMKHLCLTILCCLVPLAAVAAVFMLHAPILPTSLGGMLLLVPIGYALVAEAPASDKDEARRQSPTLRPR